MRILFICTAFNSLSQRLALVLRQKGHAVTVELAVSPELMISAAELAQPDLVVCPFLTKRVPREVYTRWLTLIVHPGPPRDAGPSALDFCLIGDDGSLEDAEAQLALLDQQNATQGATPTMRSHWGVTVLQAIEEFDAGPIWAFDQFALDAETSKFTKSDLYRGPVTRAAVNGVLAAIDRIVAATQQAGGKLSAELTPPSDAGRLCVSSSLPFQGGPTRDRPLLKASARDFVHLARSAQQAGHKLNADIIVRRINCGDSQPGVLSSLFGAPLFLYDACVQKGSMPASITRQAQNASVGTILATRDGAVLVDVGADFPIWISHLRKPKAKADRYLAPKLPAVQALLSIDAVAEKSGIKQARAWPIHDAFDHKAGRPWAKQEGTYQPVWVDLELAGEGALIGYVYFEFYNGATATESCKVLLQAIEWTLRQPGLKAIVLMGGAGYFSNGIALNVIEGAEDPSAESWFNINAIDDCVRAVLAPSGVLTFSAIRANCAAGGLALATACDVVLCSSAAVLNPHYRGLGLYGSEYHTYSWYERCGSERAAEFARTMLPMSSTSAREIGLVDIVLGEGIESPSQIEQLAKQTVGRIMQSTLKDAEQDVNHTLRAGAPWTKPLLRHPAKDSTTLAEHYLACKRAYLTCLFASRLAERDTCEVTVSFAEGFAAYRKAELDNMVLDFFHPVRGERYASRRLAFVRKLASSKTSARFALHRRFGKAWAEPESSQLVAQEQDEEELDAFDGLGDVPAQVAFDRLAVVLSAQSIARSASQGTMGSNASGLPELTATSNGPSPPDTPQPASPKEALDLQVESLAVPAHVLDRTGDSLMARSLATPRSSSISFVEHPVISESHGSTAPRTAKVTRMSPPNMTARRASSRSISSFNFGGWGRKESADVLIKDLPLGTDVVGLAILPSSHSQQQDDARSQTKASAATRLFNKIARRSKSSLNNLSQATTQLRRSSMSVRRDTVQIETEEVKLVTQADAEAPAPPIIYACYYNSDDTPRPLNAAATTPAESMPQTVTA
ncbi:hypothetical protein A4X13_0g1124 [Tilletia indica]|uniref:Formyl transferase C-terminal domain-containing protein n=1 Tax=Tilletia indica TaxID=43049 RepID=A0A177TZ32_9BASI|nr:hypothetical protein A4X13_0g1124 [Tilletia indica]